MKLHRIVAAVALAALAPSIAAAQQGRVERGMLVLENVPETPAETRELLLQYQNTRAAGFAGFVAGGKGMLVSTRFGETSQVHHVASPMGARRQLTFFHEPVSQIAPSPTDAGLFAFARDNGGDENYQIYLFDRASGAATMLSDGKGRKGAPIWSVDGKKLAWSTTLDAGRYGVVVGDPARPGERKSVFSGDGFWMPAGWSPDGAGLLLFRFISINESEIHLLDIASGDRRRINPSPQRIAYSDVRFSADGRSLYFTSDEEGEFLNLYRYDLSTGEKKNLTAGVDWDVTTAAVAPDGRSYAFVTNEAGRSRLYLRDARTDRALAAPDLPPGVIGGVDFSPDGGSLGFTFNTTDTPGDAYVWSLTARRPSLARWTESEIGGLDASRFVSPAFFDYPTFDEVDGAPRQIPAFIYKPAGEGPHPVIVSIHGGPEAQSRPVFSSLHQFWANELGAAVILPNVRGSTGFGKTYVTLDNAMKREDSVRDIGALLDWIETQPDLDKNRVVVYGGSYGGYMVLASLVHYNDRLAGGVNIVGISNFVTFLENTAEYRRDLRRAEYGDERDPEMRAFLESISPLNNADKITKPLFIIQGLNDPRVPASEADQILAAVKANGGTPWYMAAKDEGHGFAKKSNRDAMTEAVALFLEEVLSK